MGLDQWLSKNGDEVIYWRKANQIHKYFDTLCDGVENLETYEVTIIDLKNLRNLCKKVVDAHNEKTSRKLLPRMMGCFFGDYNYDTIYYKELERTIGQLDYLIEIHNENDYYDYKAWW